MTFCSDHFANCVESGLEWEEVAVLVLVVCEAGLAQESKLGQQRTVDISEMYLLR